MFQSRMISSENRHALLGTTLYRPVFTLVHSLLMTRCAA